MPERPGSDITLRGVAVIGVRVAGLVFAIRGLLMLPFADGAARWYAGAELLVGVALWLGVHHVVGRMLPARRADSIERPRAETGALGPLVFAALGLYLFADALPAVIEAVRSELSRAEPGWPRVLGVAAPLIVGILVFFGAGGLARLVGWLRRAGHTGG